MGWEFRWPWRRHELVPAVAHLTRDGRGGEIPPWRFPVELQVQHDLSPARWIEESLPKHPWASLGSLVPDGFKAYARILHPAHRDAEPWDPVRWAEVAAVHGRTLHRLAQFALIADLEDTWNDSPAGMTRPEEGELPSELVAPLTKVLRETTATPDRCWFALWRGDGMLSVLEGFEHYPQFKVPGREYLLLSGALDALSIFPSLDVMGPQIWWPDDHAWCVATEVDLDSTYVGGSAACIEAIAARPELEVFPAEPADRVDIGADTVNARPD